MPKTAERSGTYEEIMRLIGAGKGLIGWDEIVSKLPQNSPDKPDGHAFFTPVPLSETDLVVKAAIIKMTQLPAFDFCRELKETTSLFWMQLRRFDDHFGEGFPTGFKDQRQCLDKLKPHLIQEGIELRHTASNGRQWIKIRRHR